LFWPALGLGSDVQRCSVYRAVNEVSPTALYTTYVSLAGSIFLAIQGPTGQKDRITENENIAVGWFLCSAGLKSNVWNYSTNKMCLPQAGSIFKILLARRSRSQSGIKILLYLE